MSETGRRSSTHRSRRRNATDEECKRLEERLKRSEEALRASERRFQGFVEHAADAFFMTDVQGRILDVNGRACEAGGYTRDELIGMAPYAWVADLNSGVVEDRVRRLVAGETVVFEDRYRRKDGTVFEVEVRGKAFRDGQSTVLAYALRDVTTRKRAEAALRESEERFRGTFENAAVGIAHADLTGRFLRVNEKLCSILGYSRDELLQKTFREITHPDELAASIDLFAGLIRGDSPGYAAEKRYRRKDGSPIWVELVVSLQREAAGTPLYAIGIIQDISARRRAQDERDRLTTQLRLLLESTDQGIHGMDLEGRCTFINQADVQILGYSPEEVLGRGMHALIHHSYKDGSPYPQSECPIYKVLHEGPGCRLTEEVLWRRDGTSFPAEYSSFPIIHDGRRQGAVVTITDISKRKRAEQELRKTKEAAEAASRAKDEFLANVSHEIRTPMNAILGMAELTLDTPLSDEQRGYLNIVLASAEGLLNLINDLLDFSKIEAGRLELDEVDFSLRLLLNQTLRALALGAHKKGLELACQVEPDVPDGLMGDGNRLRQVLLNLIGNAIKFTESGEVIVRVRAQKVDEQAVVMEFEVADTGIGIPPQKQQKIFGAFEQADNSTTRRYGGTGLGLTISSRLVGLMGGQIRVESEVGRGSTFRFSARFGRSSHLPAAIASSPVLELNGLRVLIVDDSETNRRIVHGWVTRWGMNPTTTASGTAAMSALRQAIASKAPFSLVLLDARMPGTGGLEWAEVMREAPELNACRIILLTSDERPGDAERYRSLGIASVLMKPVQQEELLDIIYRVLSQRAGTAKPAKPRGPVRVPKTAPATQTASSRPLSVLVAEDKKFNQQVIRRMLERRGHAVTMVDDGKQALAALEQGNFDLLLLDVNMPVMDGCEAIKIIREREKTTKKHLRVVALTALSGNQDRERCVQAGMDGYLAKPIRAADVYATLERVMQSHPDASPVDPELIDPTVLLGACGGDGTMLAEMIQLFQKEAPELLGEVEAASRVPDTERLRKAAHALRGLVSAFSTKVARTVKTMEQIAVERRTGDVDEQYEALSHAVGDLHKALTSVTIEKLRVLASTPR